MTSAPFYIRQIIVLVSNMLFLVTIAQSESFDGLKASTKVEKLICNDYDVSILDDDLSEAYQKSA